MTPDGLRRTLGEFGEKLIARGWPGEVRGKSRSQTPTPGSSSFSST
jgi:hypothetical protein